MGARLHRVPSSTYRLQLSSDYGFRQARSLVAYLARLGISDLYTSPVLAARPGSEHGYDVVDPTKLDPELGGAAAFDALSRTLREQGMGLLVDIVPNHMAAHHENPWWNDLLQHGKASRYSSFFDIDWQAGGGTLLLPVLGDDVERVIERGELGLGQYDGETWLCYYEKRWPLAPDSLHLIDGDLAHLLCAQHYRLRRWNAERAVNYRRFFNISDLAALRVERPEVFEAAHALLLGLVESGSITGLRVDHPDGLLDPEGYVRRLQAAVSQRCGDAALYLVVEKILAADERLRQSWPVAGTTGYEQLELLGGVLIDERGEQPLRDLYADVTGQPVDFPALAYECKRLVLGSSLAPEVDRLTRRLSELAPEIDRATLRLAVVELAAAFPVYRSYVPPRARSVSGEDLRLLSAALLVALERLPEAAPAFDVLKSALLLEPPLAETDAGLAACRAVLLRFQQLTGPAAAKGVEDTAFYRYLPLASLAEVGGEPSRFGVGLEELHREMLARARDWPLALSATSTHDTKRSEDVRARIGVLSEIPHEWATAVRAWEQLAAAYLENGAPDANDRYLLYQTLVGVWPPGETRASGDLVGRLVEYMIKAAREAKRHTRWVDQDPQYEARLRQLVERLLDSSAFCEAFCQFHPRVARAGMYASLAQLVLKIAAPGVPDFYQGSELWDLSLVDPDNRRPVDFELRSKLLASLPETEPSILLDDLGSGRIKLFITTQGLAARKRQPRLFAEGSYHPATALGDRADQVVAFARRFENQAVLAIVGRFFTRFDGKPIGGAWGNTKVKLPEELPSGTYREAFTEQRFELDGSIELAMPLGGLPVALLERVA